MDRPTPRLLAVVRTRSSRMTITPSFRRWKRHRPFSTSNSSPLSAASQSAAKITGLLHEAVAPGARYIDVSPRRRLNGRLDGRLDRGSLHGRVDLSRKRPVLRIDPRPARYWRAVLGDA